jgi:hypothetical protein
MPSARFVGVSWIGCLVASVAIAQPLAIGPRDYGAQVSLDYVDGSDRGVGWYSTVRVEATQRLTIRGERAELVVTGRFESRGAFLSPGGPERSRRHEEDFTHTWSGTARREGSEWRLRFTHTTSTRPARDCDESLRCVPDADVRGALRCTSDRTFGHHGNDAWIPTYLRVPLLLARGRAIHVDATGSDSGHARVTVRERSVGVRSAR